MDVVPSVRRAEPVIADERCKGVAAVSEIRLALQVTPVAEDPLCLRDDPGAQHPHRSFRAGLQTGQREGSLHDVIGDFRGIAAKLGRDVPDALGKCR